MSNNQKLLKIQQNTIQKQAAKADAYSFFNLLTSSKLLSVIEAQLPEHRERLYPPTTTLSLFLAQAMNADSSCQNTVDRHVVERIFNGLPACSIMTGAYCKARQRLPTDMVSTLVMQTGKMVADQSPNNWLCDQWGQTRLIRIRHYGYLANRIRVVQLKKIRDWISSYDGHSNACPPGFDASS